LCPAESPTEEEMTEGIKLEVVSLFSAEWRTDNPINKNRTVAC